MLIYFMACSMVRSILTILSLQRFNKSVTARQFFILVAAPFMLMLSSCQPDKRGLPGAVTGGVTDTSITYYKHIAPIIATHCLGCHTEKGPGPIDLRTYANISFNAEMIRYVINRHLMPPWLADHTGWDFANKRVLSPQELDTMNRWMDNGMYRGDSVVSRVPAQSIIFEGRKPDLVLHLAKNFFIKGDNHESFQKASFTFENDSAFPVEAIEIVSKQMKVAHHASYVIKGRSNFSRSSEEFLLGNDLFKDSSVVIIGGWLPGIGGLKFPDGFGFYMPRKGEVDLEFHYSPSPIDLVDSAEVHIYRATKPITRTCSFLTVANDDSDCILSPRPFEIEPNERKKFTMAYQVKQDYTVLIVTPHMHYLGKKYKASIIEPDGHINRMINLDNWVFSQQDQYLCNPFHKLSKGSTLKLEAEYDNTINNIQNPSSPPQLVKPGWGTRSEMMVLILMVTKYQPGDEFRTWKTNTP